MKIAKENIAVLAQVGELLSRLSNELFVKKQSLINQATVGQHIRHILEFYQCILIGLRTGNVSYDERKRNAKIETNRKYALELIDDLILQLGKIENDCSINLCASYSSIEIRQEQIISSLKREIAYALDHTIHHLAIVRIVLKNEGVYVDPAMGVAPSTLRYRKEMKILN